MVRGGRLVRTLSALGLRSKGASRSGFILFLLALNGCVSAGYHQKMLTQVRMEELHKAEEWTIRVKKNDLDLPAMLILLQDRESKLQPLTR